MESTPLFRSGFVIIAICILFLWFARLGALALECEPIRRDAARPEAILIGDSWSGARVTFGSVARGDKVYVGYYDAERFLTVAEIDQTIGRLCRARLASRFGGWDSHNYTTLVFDAKGRLHVSGNMHATPLVYGRAERANSLEGLKLEPMVGRDELRTTYPIFLHDNEERLLLLYRSGVSGDGVWLLNRFDGEKWRRVGGPLFTDRYDGRPVSAYPSPFVRDEAGVTHVAVVWRARPDAAANFAVSYAHSRDLETWFDQDGRPIRPPLSPDNMETVEITGQGAGLLNSVQIFPRPSEQPVLTYTRYGDDGKNIVVLARSENGVWKKTVVGRAEQHIPIDGGGSLPAVPRFGNLQFDHATRRASIDVGFPGAPTRRQALAYDTLEPLGPPEGIPAAPEQRIARSLPRPEGLANPVVSVLPVKRSGASSSTEPVGFLYYIAQATSRDRPCQPGEPRACEPPPSPIIYIVREQ